MMHAIKPIKITVNQQAIILKNTVGTLLGITEQGKAIVDFPENSGEPLIARSTLNESHRILLNQLPIEVLLTFDPTYQSSPIITGIVNDSLFAPLSQPEQGNISEQETLNISSTDKSKDLKIDGKKMTFNAKDEILLRCGKSSILLRKDGKIVIKGSNLISRSSSSNKIKGGNVSIN